MNKSLESAVLVFKLKKSIKFDTLDTYSQYLFKDLFQSYITYFSYTIIDKSTLNWKRKSKQYLFKEKNIEKFKKEIKNLEHGDIGFEYLKTLPNCEYKYKDIEYSISYSETSVYPTIKIIFNRSHNQINNRNLILLISEFIHDNQNEIVYGFTTVIPNEKIPAFYVEGISSENLDELERDNLSKWANNERNCNIAIWDVFQGNILTLNHLKNKEEISKFRSEFKEYITPLNQEVYLLDFTGLEREKLSNLNKKVVSFVNTLR